MRLRSGLLALVLCALVPGTSALAASPAGTLAQTAGAGGCASMQVALGCTAAHGLDDARAAWAELLKVNPDFSMTQRARVLPYKDSADFQRIVDGLAKAGLP